jgi:hypothetical protein
MLGCLQLNASTLRRASATALAHHSNTERAAMTSQQTDPRRPHRALSEAAGLRAQQDRTNVPDRRQSGRARHKQHGGHDIERWIGEHIKPGKTG